MNNKINQLISELGGNTIKTAKRPNVACIYLDAEAQAIYDAIPQGQRSRVVCEILKRFGNTQDQEVTQ